MGFLVLLLLGVGLVWGPLQKYRQVNRARQALLESQPERALDALQSLNADRPNDAQINYLLARAYRRSGNLKQAQSHLEQAQRSGWSSEEVNQQRHLALLQSGQIQETEAFFKRLLNQGVSDEIAVEFYEAQAMALLHGYRFKEAMVCLNFWIDWRPQDVRPRMWRGEIWDRILYHKDAIREYSSVLEVAPDHLDARRHLAKSLFESHKFEQALEHYQQCTQIDSSDTEARIGVAQCNLRLLNIDVAEQQLRALLQVDLNDDQRTRVAIVLATLVLDKKQPQEAIRILDDLKGLAKTNPEALYVLGRAYNQTGDSAKGSEFQAQSKRLYTQFSRLAEITTELLVQPRNANLRFEAGKLLMEQGLVSEGAAWLSTALQDDPNHKEAQAALAAYFANAQASTKSNLTNSAAADATNVDTKSAVAVVQKPPLDPLTARILEVVKSKNTEKMNEMLAALQKDAVVSDTTRLLKGAIALESGEIGTAMQEFQRAWTNPATRECVMVLTGKALAQSGRTREAELVWQQAVAENPDAEEAHRLLTMLYYDLGAMDNAQTHALKVGALAPNDPRPFRLLGLVRKDSEHYDDAIQHYDEALRRRPQPPALDEIRLERAECAIKLGRHEEALNSLKECPRNNRRLVLEAQCHFYTNRRDVAKLLLSEALAADPKDFDALYLQGITALEGSDPATAVQGLSRAVAVRAKDYEANRLLLQAYRQLGDSSKAEALQPIVEHLRKLRLEFSELHERATAQPANVDIRFRLGQVALELDQPDLARLWFGATLAMNPQHEAAQQELAKLRQAR